VRPGGSLVLNQEPVGEIMKATLHGPIVVLGEDLPTIPVYVVRVDAHILCVSVDGDACKAIVERVNNCNIHDLLPLVVDSFTHIDPFRRDPL